MSNFSNVKFILETERLTLREWNEGDAEVMYLLNSDAEVMRYTGDIHFDSVPHALELIQNYTHYATYGYGRWATILKETGEFIGWCGLKYHPDDDVVDLGYRFFKKHWGKGYASEAGRACLDYGFEHLGLERIVAHAMVENTASERVMQKIGMTRVGLDTCEGHPAVVYEMNNPKLIK